MSMGETQQTEHNWESLKKKVKSRRFRRNEPKRRKKKLLVFTHTQRRFSTNLVVFTKKNEYVF